jgi:hypothetical protein
MGALVSRHPLAPHPFTVSVCLCPGSLSHTRAARAGHHHMSFCSVFAGMSLYSGFRSTYGVCVGGFEEEEEGAESV